MIKVVYNLDGKIHSVSSESKEFLVLNNSRTFFHHLETESKYKGFFTPFKDSMIRTVNGFISFEQTPINKITHKGFEVTLHKKDFYENFFIPENSKSFVYTTNSKAFQIVLDVKKIFDNREFGRIYEVYVGNGKTIIHFQKKTSFKDNDKSDNKLEYEIFLVFNSELHVAKQWVKFKMDFDQSRKSPPYERYMFIPGYFKTKQLIITVGDNLQKAHDENCILSEQVSQFKELSEQNFNKLIKWKTMKPNIAFSYNLSRYYLHQLSTPEGIIAGLPWFFHEWTRDELIALPTILKIKPKEYGKQVFINLIENIDYDGRLTSKAGGSHKVQDSIGLLFRFAYLLLTKHKTLFTKKELDFISKKLEMAGYNLLKYHLKDNLLFNDSYETWMDSIERQGFRIEIQTLLIEILEVMKLITKETHYLRLQNNLIKKIKTSYFDGKYLYDGLNDKTIRNNIFLAYYFNKKILTPNEWRIVFTDSLKKLWLNWGGISSLDKESPKFIDSNTGEIPSSYHNGDSWFFINNIAGISFFDLDRKMFKSYIEKIINSSASSCLKLGALGCMPEISSALKLKSEGCPLQTWSLSTFIELIDKVIK